MHAQSYFQGTAGQITVNKIFLFYLTSYGVEFCIDPHILRQKVTSEEVTYALVVFVPGAQQ